ncbi:UPF0280 family protein [Methanofollis formosanus]|uniref:UPF0280 protein E2N92_02105 n=1 Tax=Methanofollis formosanus TaxID=299308 RepID=A0A8G1A079_9EURY|nr:UPF0280 family protein [Methanofollis formosanus]QYZ78308.1 UPF0280 family protein [Methanofollis formosanus]
MIREHFEYKQTITTVLADEEAHVAAAKEGMLRAREELERFIAADPFFGMTFEPYAPDAESLTVRRMGAASLEAGVGPMAAVAGTIAWAGAEAMQEAGARFGVVDNGGDIALFSNREVRVGVHAGASSFSDRLAFVVPPQEEILGICTSSATVGPSISFGVADAVSVFSRDVSRADAWATSLCNTFAPGDERSFAALKGTAVEGVLMIIGEEVGIWGEVPEIVGATVDPSLITRGESRPEGRR